MAAFRSQDESRTAGSLAISLQSIADGPITTRVSFPSFELTSARLGTFQEAAAKNVTIANGSVSVHLAPGPYVTLMVGGA